MAVDHASAINGVFKNPFTEQVAFFRGKLGNLVPTAAWDDIQKSAHDRAFMVAGAAKADLLADLGAAVDKSISQGQSLGEFRKDFRAIVEKRGWHGWTGEATAKGEAWRTRLIYQTNAQTSYNAGRYAQLESFDYWIYKHSESAKTPRPQHLVWHNLALPKDHPFWLTHSPQNGWGCQCYVVGARNPNGIKRLGGDPDKALPRDWDDVDPKTGAPVGIDKGWDYQPGQTVVDVINAAAEKTVHWPYELAKAHMSALPQPNRDILAQAYRGLASTAKAAQDYAKKALAKQEVAPYFTLGMATSSQAKTIENLLDGKSVGGFDFALDASAIGYINKHHGKSAGEALRGQKAIDVADFAKIPLVLNDYSSIIEPGMSDGSIFKVVRDAEGERWNLLFEYRSGRKMLVLKTFYIHRKE